MELRKFLKKISSYIIFFKKVNIFYLIKMYKMGKIIIFSNLIIVNIVNRVLFRG